VVPGISPPAGQRRSRPVSISWSGEWQKKMKKIPMSEKKAKARQKQDDAWISMRTGLIVITVLSVGLALLTAWTTVPALGWFEGFL